jgi:hypothetical protein
MSALKKALTDAGMNAADRLREIEDDIARQGLGFADSMDVYRAQISGDPALLWEAFAIERDRILKNRLAAAFERRRAGDATKAVPKGQFRRASPTIRTMGHVASADQIKNAPRPTARLDFTAQRRALAPIVRTILETMMTPLGRPIGEITGEEAKTLHGRSRREMKIYAWVANRTPENELVRDHVKAKELEAFVRATDKENDNA